MIRLVVCFHIFIKPPECFNAITSSAQSQMELMAGKSFGKKSWIKINTGKSNLFMSSNRRRHLKINETMHTYSRLIVDADSY